MTRKDIRPVCKLAQTAVDVVHLPNSSTSTSSRGFFTTIRFSCSSGAWVWVLGMSNPWHLSHDRTCQRGGGQYVCAVYVHNYTGIEVYITVDSDNVYSTVNQGRDGGRGGEGMEGGTEEGREGWSEWVREGGREGGICINFLSLLQTSSVYITNIKPIWNAKSMQI